MTGSKAELLKAKLQEKKAAQEQEGKINPLEAIRKQKEQDRVQQLTIEKDAQDENKAHLIAIEDIIPLHANGEIMHNRSGMTSKEQQELQHFADSLHLTKKGSLYNTGLIQAITVRPSAIENGKYELIAGHRRKEAFVLNQQTHIPAIIVDVDDKTARRLRNAENKQRRALNAYDRIYGELEEVQLYCEFNSMEETKQAIKQANTILQGGKKSTQEQLVEAKELADTVFEIVQKKISTFVNNLTVLDVNGLIRKYLLSNEINQEEARALKKIAKNDEDTINNAVEYLKKEEEKEKRPSIKQLESYLREITQLPKTNRGARGNRVSEIKNSALELNVKKYDELESDQKELVNKSLQLIEAELLKLSEILNKG